MISSNRSKPELDFLILARTEGLYQDRQKQIEKVARSIVATFSIHTKAVSVRCYFAPEAGLDLIALFY